MDTANALAELRRESQSIFNRIHSIAEDAAFVKQVHDHYPNFSLIRMSRSYSYPADADMSQPTCAAALGIPTHTSCV